MTRSVFGLSMLALVACAGKSSSDGNAGDDAECSGFDDDAGWSVAVSLMNQTSRSIYLGQTLVNCGIEQLFQVSDAAGEPLWELSSCRHACEKLIDGDDQSCPVICLYPTATRLEPGEATNTVWSGLHRVDLEVPGECTPLRKIATVACDRAEQIEPGSFTFGSQAGTSIDCSQTIGMCRACTPNGNGGCTTAAALISGTLLRAETTVTLDASYGVGGTSAGGPTLPVEIVFTE